MSIIGITGYAQNGKDTAGQILVEEYGYERLALADAVKRAALTLDPYIPDWSDMFQPPIRLSRYVALVGPEEAKKHPEVRRLYQVMGTEVGRDLLGPDTWIRAAERKMEPGRDYVITDVRFPNEAEMIGRLGGELWRVVRLNPDGSTFDNGLGTSHPSERFVGQLEYDCLITARSVQAIRDAVMGLME